MQDLFSDGAKETRAVLTELLTNQTYHPERRSPAELASDVVRELAYRGLLREDGADTQEEVDPAADRYRTWLEVRRLS
jgi:hypothetical protein